MSHSTWEIVYYPSLIALGIPVCMVVILKTPNLPLENFFHCDVDLLVVSFDSMPRLGYPLRVVELVVDALCALPLLEPYIGLLEMM
jgi:hypothetical protein